jgi:hypothetical protein
VFNQLSKKEDLAWQREYVLNVERKKMYMVEKHAAKITLYVKSVPDIEQIAR